jgi:hypothetical protein
MLSKEGAQTHKDNNSMCGFEFVDLNFPTQELIFSYVRSDGYVFPCKDM